MCDDLLRPLAAPPLAWLISRNIFIVQKFFVLSVISDQAAVAGGTFGLQKRWWGVKQGVVQIGTLRKGSFNKNYARKIGINQDCPDHYTIKTSSLSTVPHVCCFPQRQNRGDRPRFIQEMLVATRKLRVINQSSYDHILKFRLNPDYAPKKNLVLQLVSNIEKKT